MTPIVVALPEKSIFGNLPLPSSVDRHVRIALPLWVIENLPIAGCSIRNDHKARAPIVWRLLVTEGVEIEELLPCMTYWHILPEISLWMIDVDLRTPSIWPQSGDLRNGFLCTAYVGTGWCPSPLSCYDASSRNSREHDEMCLLLCLSTSQDRKKKQQLSSSHP